MVDDTTRICTMAAINEFGWLYALYISEKKENDILRIENDKLRIERDKFRGEFIRLVGEQDELYDRLNSQNRRMAHLKREWEEESWKKPKG